MGMGRYYELMFFYFFRGLIVKYLLIDFCFCEIYNVLYSL